MTVSIHMSMYDPLTRTYPQYLMAHTMDNKELWSKTLEDIKKEVSTANFFLLFKSTSLLSVDNNIATIAVPSAIAISMIQKKYLAIVKASIEKYTDAPVTVTFLAKETEEKKKNLPPEPLFNGETTVAKKPLGHLPRVRPDFTFETLAVSDSNRLAFESAKSVAKNMGGVYNPFFIYGPVGVGKTHLMQAIANEVYLKTPEIKVIYMTSEEFTNEVVEAIRNADTAKMKRRFRSANLLIIDDVQFIAGKDKVQEELFHTFNTLIDSGGQIALSSDRPPTEIKKLEARLSSRFVGGLTVDIEAPDFEMRTAIVLKKSEKFGFMISIEIAKAIAEKEQDVRSLEGALLRVMTEVTTRGEEPTTELVIRSLTGGDRPKTLHLHSEDFIEHACTFYNIKTTQLKGPRRDASLVRARQVTMYLLKKELGLSFVEIGNILGGRDHTTIMHGVEKVENMLKSMPSLSEEIKGIIKEIRG